MRIRTIAAASAAALAVTSAVFAASGTAQAAGGRVDVPEAVSINQAYEIVPWFASIPWSANPDDYQACFINLENTRTRALIDFDMLDSTGAAARRGSFKIYDWQHESAPASYRVFLDGSDCPASGAVDNFVVRFASRTGVAAKRVGRYVTVTGTAYNYSPIYPAWQSKPGTRLSIQQWNGKSWVTVKSGVSNSRGQFSVRVYRPTLKAWRVVSAITPKAWPSTSTTARR